MLFIVSSPFHGCGRGRIVDLELIEQRVSVEQAETFDDVQVLVPAEVLPRCRKPFPDLKFVVSTISVLPSQRPVECPSGSATLLGG